MASEAEYSAFEEKVRRTVYLDNLSPQVTEPVVRKAISQFGTVKNVQFIPNYLETKNIPVSALVEMENPRQANAIVSEISHRPFMVGGIPRPVRAREAKPEMFEDRPAKPGRKIEFRWVETKDPDFEVANKLKQLAKDHALEVDIALNQQLEDEEKLAERQQGALKANHEKYEMINGVITDGTAKRLAQHYHIPVADECF
ncbi:ASI1-immunoprecipitated protein 1-like isoform X2 [Rosa rugosa]|nr:ASI1-immunoprecipitated protein 1-like isoform X2 [Rosa rugosa]XP_061994848.1 ASI1-immunoprecipitated protein 1-like isoform X2 [Rosa rugosa]XP_061994849.1 ASI1-immunoprecipitated protein 1-like isoform X2 [Rosa rugosa]XP_061994851.1 ASI1-immunoprecipitated protein 1-like isoform X2 [Rosa rugosa]XP_061994852.1 ASI1-immunoprecipitated protein 1-like isoform X2 [Rosa rugosa]XP_061994853.1 ASI1-immunoprecipitated protein 1-like isoform X2 [Rosa rugosa]